MVKEQTAEWTELMNAHRKAEWDMVKIHLKAQVNICNIERGSIRLF